MVNLALQDIKGLNKTVSNRSFFPSIKRAAIIAGTLQPKPIKRGKKALPGNPSLRITRSNKKATRAI